LLIWAAKPSHTAETIKYVVIVVATLPILCIYPFLRSYDRRGRGKLMLPLVTLGKARISRLVIGGNHFSGNSHISREIDNEMMDFFTCARIKETLFRCMECGVNAMQLRGDKHIIRILREFRAESGNMHWIA
jgi:hypothetical protein